MLKVKIKLLPGFGSKKILKIRGAEVKFNVGQPDKSKIDYPEKIVVIAEEELVDLLDKKHWKIDRLNIERKRKL